MSGHSQSKDENMFQHKGAGKQEVGQPSERGLSYKSHISANVWILSSPKRSEIGLRNGIESLTVKFGSSLKFKNKCFPRGQGTLSDLIEFRMQEAKEKHPPFKSLFCSASSVLGSPVPLCSQKQKARSGQLFCTQCVCAEAPHTFLTRNRLRESGLGCSNQAGTSSLQTELHSTPWCRSSYLELFARCL